MGVHGLWKLIDPVGKIVPLEGMAGKVLAVDVSIWLHQAIKGMHDAHGAPVAVSHLLILFHRLCKLLYYKIKPVFVFDGGVPALKRDTISKRRNVRSAARSEALKVRGKLLKNLLKHEAIRQMLSDGQNSTNLSLSSFTLPGTSAEEDLYILPQVSEEQSDNISEVSSEEGDMKFTEDIHTIDITSSDFKTLPREVRHEILLELIETRKQSSWKNLDKMPKEGDNFSDYQMNRLLKRRAVQASLDEIGKEMVRVNMTLKDLEEMLLNENYPLSKEDILPGKRIAQSAEARYLLVHKSDDTTISGGKVSDLPVKEDCYSRNGQGDSPNRNHPTPSLSTNHDAHFNSENFNEMVSDDVLTQDEIYEIIKKENDSISHMKDKCIPVCSAAAGEMENNSLDSSTCVTLEKDGDQVEPLYNSDMLTTDAPSSQMITNEMDVTELSVNSKGEADSGNVKYQAINMEKPNTLLIHKNEVINKTINGSHVNSVTNLKPVNISVFKEDIQLESDITNKIAESDSVRCDPNPQSKSVPEGNMNLKIHADQSSDDSDGDFITVAADVHDCELSNPIFDIPIAEESNVQPIEINIDKNKCPENEDIFADIFLTVHENNYAEEGKIQVTDHHLEESNKEKYIFEKEMTEPDLRQFQNSVADDCLSLAQEQGKQERMALNVSDQMNSDAQELLRLFGVPYVIAPMEAEAQCAVLEVIGLTNGTITDDSDIWLFGGRVVYKNFFNQKKHVREYKSDDIEKYFKLSREDMIKMALLVGSDYTSGLDGVGPVTALEILGAFPGDILSGLKNFRNWFTDSHDSNFKRSLRNKIKNSKVGLDFPSEAVVKAYLHPQVDDSKEPFSWAKPNVALIQKYTKIKFGWSEEKCSKLLIPVITRMTDNKKDTTLEKYFNSISKDLLLQGSLSKRVENAIKHLRNEQSSEIEITNNDNKSKKSTVINPSSNPSTSQSKKSRVNFQRKEPDSRIPQKRTMEIVFEERKKTAIKIFKNDRKKKSKRQFVSVVKKEINLSESDSDN